VRFALPTLNAGRSHAVVALCERMAAREPRSNRRSAVLGDLVHRGANSSMRAFMSTCRAGIKRCRVNNGRRRSLLHAPVPANVCSRDEIPRPRSTAQGRSDGLPCEAVAWPRRVWRLIQLSLPVLSCRWRSGKLNRYRGSSTAALSERERLERVVSSSWMTGNSRPGGDGQRGRPNCR
jgi:hypothetical protein